MMVVLRLESKEERRKKAMEGNRKGGKVWITKDLTWNERKIR